MPNQISYRAFISYAHKDEGWASWLHKRLENYRIPGRIVQEHRLKSNRLIPIFRDRDELTTSDDLSRTIQQALRASENLIVICSSHAAGSRWVNREIEYFRELGRDDCIQYLLIDEPGRSFPDAALRNPVNDGAAASIEPLAADGRPEGDGKAAALQKLIAGLLKLRLDEVVRREAARKTRRLSVILAGALAGLVLTSGLTLYALDQRGAALEQERQASLARDAAVSAQVRAEQAQAESEEVVQFLIGMFEISDPSQAMGKDIGARQLLDVGSRRIEQEFAGQPLVKARLMLTMGLVYESLGLFEEATALIDKSLNLRRAKLGNAHPQVAESLAAMVGPHIFAEDLDKAESVARDALAMRENLQGDQHPAVADSLVVLYQVFNERGQYAEAQQVLLRARAIRETALGKQHPDTASAVHYLAKIVHLLGRHEEAESLAMGALEVQRAIYQNNPHPDIAESLNDLGVIALQRGQYDKAQEYYQSYVDMLRILMPENHPDIAVALENLGAPFYFRREFQEAANLLEQALDIRRKAFGKNHPVVARTLVNQGTVLMSADDLDRADAKFKEALPILRQYWEGDHPELSTVLASMGLLAAKRGAEDESISLLTEAVAVSTAHYGEEHQEPAKLKIRLARTLIEQKQFQRAEVIVEQARSVLAKVYGEDHHDRVEVNELLAKIDQAR